MAHIHVRSWQAGYRGIFPDDFLDALTPDERIGRYALGAAGPGAPRTLLAFPDAAERPAGFSTFGACRDPTSRARAS